MSDADELAPEGAVGVGGPTRPRKGAPKPQAPAVAAGPAVPPAPARAPEPSRPSRPAPRLVASIQVTPADLGKIRDPRRPTLTPEQLEQLCSGGRLVLEGCGVAIEPRLVREVVDYTGGYFLVMKSGPPLGVRRGLE